MESEIIEVRKKLEEYIKENDLEKILKCLDTAKGYKITKELLKSTDVGKAVGKLRTHKDIGISKASTECIDKWKVDIEDTTTTTTKKTTTTTTTTTLSSTSSTSSSSSSPRPTLKRKSSYESILKDIERPVKKLVEEVKSEPTTPKLSSSFSNITPIKGAHADIRNKSIQLFVESLTMEVDDTISGPEEIATEIEAELFDIYKGITNDYKTKMRSFKFNIKKNESLRLSLLNRELSTQDFCTMDVLEMANDHLKEERKKLEKYATEASIDIVNNESTTDQFKCGRCKQRKCTYRTMQTRSADEPETVFVRCMNCNNRWKFC